MEIFHLKSRLSKKKKQFNALVAIVIHLVGHDRRIINPLYQTQSKINQNRDDFNGSDKLVVPATVFERQLTPKDVDGNTCQDYEPAKTTIDFIRRRSYSAAFYYLQPFRVITSIKITKCIQTGVN